MRWLKSKKAKKQGGFVRLIRSSMKEYYGREVSFTLPTSNYYNMSQDRILELLPTKIHYYFQNFDRFSCRGQSHQCPFFPLYDLGWMLLFFPK